MIEVRDHCHIADEYSGSAHKIYNANFRLTKEIPVISVPNPEYIIFGDTIYLCYCKLRLLTPHGRG